MKIFALLLMGALHVQAAESAAVDFQPRLVGESSKGSLLLGTEYATFSAPAGNLSGVGFNLGYHYLINSNLGLKGNISQAFNPSDKMSFLYTGFGAQATYALLGSWSQSHEEIEWRGKTIVSVKSKKETIWGVQAGLEQLLFGGSSAVYNAPGMSVGAFSKFEIWNQDFLASVAYGSYTTSGSAIMGLTLKLQFLLNGK